MSNEEFAEELGSIFDNNRNEIISDVLDLVKRKLEDVSQITFSEIEKEIERSNLVHRVMTSWAERWVANEVGNRLRCGIWDGKTVDRIFDSIWTEQFDIAIRDRIKTKAREAVDAVIAERLKTLATKGG